MITIRDLKATLDKIVEENKEALDYNVIVKQETADGTQVTVIPNNCYVTGKNFVIPIGRPQ